MRATRLALAVLFLAAAPSFADGVFTELYSIGPDSDLFFPVPRTFNSISTGGVTTPLFDLGDRSLGFTGGLAFNPDNNLFYAIANDSSGNSSLVSFSRSGGGYVPIGSLGAGFFSGLAYNTLDHSLYGISSGSELNRIGIGGAVTPLGSLGAGYFGGLTYRSADGLLYAFSADDWGTQRVFHSIAPDASAVTELFSLGDGTVSFNGGVAFNEQDGLFYAIANDGLGDSSLQRFTPAGALALVADMPDGFVNVGLAAVPAVPEPSSALPLAGCLIAWALVRFRPRAR
ncbi:MAG: hypothetical protein HY822_21250 [Acidobacteria bacterium]|nr:hypothetical protein [Acidobacteriota bacterium]